VKHERCEDARHQLDEDDDRQRRERPVALVDVLRDRDRDARHQSFLRFSDDFNRIIDDVQRAVAAEIKRNGG
jgi:hypothetical protein